MFQGYVDRGFEPAETEVARLPKHWATHRAAMKTLQQNGRLWGPKLLSLKLNAARTIEKYILKVYRFSPMNHSEDRSATRGETACLIRHLSTHYSGRRSQSQVNHLSIRSG